MWRQLNVSSHLFFSATPFHFTHPFLRWCVSNPLPSSHYLLSYMWLLSDCRGKKVEKLVSFFRETKNGFLHNSLFLFQGVACRRSAAAQPSATVESPGEINQSGIGFSVRNSDSVGLEWTWVCVFFQFVLLIYGRRNRKGLKQKYAFYYYLSWSQRLTRIKQMSNQLIF